MGLKKLKTQILFSFLALILSCSLELQYLYANDQEISGLNVIDSEEGSDYLIDEPVFTGTVDGSFAAASETDFATFSEQPLLTTTISEFDLGSIEEGLEEGKAIQELNKGLEGLYPEERLEYIQEYAQEYKSAGAVSVWGGENIGEVAVNGDNGLPEGQSKSHGQEPEKTRRSFYFPVGTNPNWLEIESVTGGLFSRSELADFVERGYKDGTVNVEQIPLKQKVDSLSPEDKKQYERLIGEEVLGLSKPYDAYKEVDVGNKKVNVYFGHASKATSEYGSYFPLTNTLVVDTPAVAADVERMKRDADYLNRKYASVGEDFNGFEIKDMDDSEIFKSRAKEIYTHELTHSLIGPLAENLAEGKDSDNQKVKQVLSAPEVKYLQANLTDGLWSRGVAELASYLAQLSASDTPQATLDSMHFDAGSRIAETNSPLDIDRPENVYAKRAVVKKIFKDLGYEDYIIKKSLENSGPYIENGRYMSGEPNGNRFNQVQAIQRDYDNGEYFRFKYLKLQQDFIQTLPSQKIKAAAKERFQEIFGAENLPSADLTQIPQEVTDGFNATNK